jgi:predicted MFS family arabinose efflux permease
MTTTASEAPKQAPETSTPSHEAPGSTRVLVLSTVSFTLMFGVWLMFGVLGVPIQTEFGLSDSQLAWIAAVAILNGSLWRLVLGVLTDRIGGRVITIFMLFATAIPTYLVSELDLTYSLLLVLAFLIGFAGNLFSVGIAWNAAWFTPRHQGFALGLFGAGNVGASLTKFIGPVLGRGRLATHPLHLCRCPCGHGPHRLGAGASPRPDARAEPSARRDVQAAERCAGLALQPVLRRRVRRVRGAGGLVTQVLRLRV